MTNSSIIGTPTLSDLLADPTRITALPPKAVAALAAGVVYATLTKNGEAAPAPAPDPGVWVGVGEAMAATGYPRRWFFRHKRMPFCKLLSRKHLLVDLGRLGKAIQSGDVRPPQPQPGAASA